MSLAQIKDQVAQLTPEEMDELRGHLKIFEVLRDPELPAQLSRSMREMDAGIKTTAEELRVLLADRQR